MAVSFYEQNTGRFIICEYDQEGTERVVYETVGYSGRAEGKNNPDLEHRKGVGPIPVGSWRIGHSFDHPRLGKLAYRLDAVSDPTFGRGGFLIHGDSREHPGNASSGCIILNRAAREAIQFFGPKQLEVLVPDRPKGED